ncbi:aspartate/glutamate racemase family protein [Falsirhodobacter sp. alg1]|uniref:aspartate/glutamate racemase family protein n=1 Tax=Falsirhodobacter sp. alg1 TaxID=1472418 RepID=UPI0005EDF0DB|nr:aspartate/glutamate racemase family protein [Falsirhodobacter sp. alg1]
MRILLVNPNMTQGMTDRMFTIASAIAGDRAEIVPLTATRGFPYIASRTEAQIAGEIALEMIAEHREGADVAIIAAFGDPGLAAARELFDMPIIGMADAAVHTAALLGGSFAVVTFTPFMNRWYEDCIKATGLSSRSRGVRSAAEKPIDVASVRDDAREELIALARDAALKDGAEVIILGGAPLAGLAPEIAADVPALVIDPISAATCQALAVAGLAPGLDYSTRATRPAPKSSVGLAGPLRALIAGDV